MEHLVHEIAFSGFEYTIYVFMYISIYMIMGSLFHSSFIVDWFDVNLTTYASFHIINNVNLERSSHSNHMEIQTIEILAWELEQFLLLVWCAFANAKFISRKDISFFCFFVLPLLVLMIRLTSGHLWHWPVSN